jgi:hypothetical protein
MDVSSLIVKKVPANEATKFFIKNHYTHSCNGLSIAYGFYNENEMVCLIGFGRPSGKNLAASIWNGGNDKNTLELLRMFSFDYCPKNTESYCISKSIKQLRMDMPNVKMLVSYADTSAGHVGYIYQASNWMFIGTGSNERKIFVDGIRQHRRSLYARYGTSSIQKLKCILGDRIVSSNDRFMKNKYIYPITKGKTEHREVVDSLKVVSIPYPKGDCQHYNDANNSFGNI